MTINQTNTSNSNEIGDRETTLKLRLLAEILPGNVPPAAMRAFELKNVQTYLFNKVLTGAKHPHSHPLWPAFDPEVTAHMLHFHEDVRLECELCCEEQFGSRGELLLEAMIEEIFDQCYTNRGDSADLSDEGVGS